MQPTSTRQTIHEKGSAARALASAHDEGLHLFCLAGSPVPAVSGLTGFGPDRVECIQHKKVTAVVSRVPASQWLGMARSLLGGEPVFRAALEAVDREVEALAGWSIIEELLADDLRSRLERTEVVQVVLFAIQVALGLLWQAWGIEPDVVVGHSVGEIAAAHLAGILSLHDACRIVVARGRVVGELAAGRGAMLLVGLGDAMLLERLGEVGQSLVVGAYNGPRSTVLSGSKQAIEQAEAILTQRGVRVRRVEIDFASHSPQMLPLIAPFEAAIADPMASIKAGQKVKATGYFGTDTVKAVKAYQKKRKLSVTGKADPLTLTRLTPDVRKGAKGAQVTAVHTLLKSRHYKVNAGSSFGAKTLKAVKSLQKKTKLPQTGIVSVKTWGKLFG